MQSATTPATWGAEALVPELVVTPPPRAVDSMHTPGAATTWAMSIGRVAKLENVAYLSSVSPASHDAGPLPPGAPSVSEAAVTVRTSG